MKGSATIEILYIMPVVFLMYVSIIYLGFFFHDKNVLQLVAVEATAIGQSQYRNMGKLNIEDMTTFIQEKANKRLLFFEEPDIQIEEREKCIYVRLHSCTRSLEITAEKGRILWNPEEKIRGDERWKGIWE